MLVSSRRRVPLAISRPVAALLQMASRLGLHDLDIESDGDLVSNENSAGLEGSVLG
jgi:hypothetical protein